MALVVCLSLLNQSFSLSSFSGELKLKLGLSQLMWELTLVELKGKPCQKAEHLRYFCSVFLTVP